MGIIIEIPEAQFAMLLDERCQRTIINPHLGLVVDIEIEHGTYDSTNGTTMANHTDGIVFVVALHDGGERLHGTGLHLGI